MKRTTKLAAILILTSAGCSARPAGEAEERGRASEAGKAFEIRPEPLPADPEPEDYVRYALASNAEVQARYWEWRAALERIPQEASLPNPTASVDLMFPSDGMSLWNRTTLGLSQAFPFPGKRGVAARAALEEARAVGLRYESACFTLRREVLFAWHDLALLAEQIRLQRTRTALLGQMAASAETQIAVGRLEPHELHHAAQLDRDLAKNTLAALQAELPGRIARLNALLGREAEASIPLPDRMPQPRPMPLSDAEILKYGASESPELAALAREVAGRENALELARKMWLPDFTLSFSFTGNVGQAAGGMLTLPLRIEAIRAAIRQAEANVRATEAARQQYSRDLSASFVLNLASFRDGERQASVFEEILLPHARQAVELSRAAYAVGKGSWPDMLDAELTMIDLKRTWAEIRTGREKALVALETFSLSMEGTGPMSSGAGANAPRSGRRSMSGGPSGPSKGGMPMK
jgi:outer membrane protein TolC